MNAIINARIYDYVTYIENGYLIYDDKIVEVGDMKNFKNKGYDKVEDFKGDLLMPTFVCAHSHIYSIFARGLALPFNPKNFQEILDQMWWKIDAQLNNKETYYSGIVAGQEFLLNGVTTVIDHHASGEITGSLSALRKAFVGPLKMRGIFCFETSDRYDVKKCLKENSSFAKKHPGEGLFGMHASMSISNKTLKGIAKVQNGVPVHVHVAESKMDVDDCLEKYGKTIIERFDEAGILIPDSLIVHGVSLSEKELDIIAKRKCYMVVNTTNMASEYMNVMFSAHLRADSPTALGVGDVQKMIRNAYEYAGRRLGVKLGEFKSGYEADFMRVKYTPFTKMDETNALGHIVFGLFPNFKPSDVYTYGKKRVKDYKIVGKSLQNQVIEARKYSEELWTKVKGGK